MIRVAISINKCDSGGQKSVIMSYLRNFNKNKVTFDLIVDKDSNSIPFKEVEELGGRIHVIPPYQNITKHLTALYQLFKENKFDVFYAANNTMNIFPLFIAWICGIKVRISESLTTASKLERKKTFIKNILRHFSHCFCNYYMANGIESAEYQFGKKFVKEGKVAIFLNPIDTASLDYDIKLREETRKKMNWTGKIVYGTIARFEIQKNPLFLIDIMYEIMKKQPQSQFAIIGIGSLEQQMKEKINKYGFGDRMSWLGRREDIKQFYNAYDAFLLPSLYEGFPVVGVESQATGLPVFFSNNVTKEANIEELGHYISLNKKAKEWADIIISETHKTIVNRRGRSEYLKKHGFDAALETERLTLFFEQAINKQQHK